MPVNNFIKTLSKLYFEKFLNYLNLKDFLKLLKEVSGNGDT